VTGYAVTFRFAGLLGLRGRRSLTPEQRRAVGMRSDRPVPISAAMEFSAGSSGTPAAFLSIKAARRRMICRSGRDMSAMRSAALSSSSAMDRRLKTIPTSCGRPLDITWSCLQS
jgi:hypothetical protein